MKRFNLLEGLNKYIVKRRDLPSRCFKPGFIARGLVLGTDMALTKTVPLEWIPEDAVDALLREDRFRDRLNEKPAAFADGMAELEAMACRLEIQSELPPMRTRVGELFTAIGVPDWRRFNLIAAQQSIYAAARQLGMDEDDLSTWLFDAKTLVQRSIGPAR